MLTLSVGDIAVFKQVLKYLEEHYIPNSVVYTDKFIMLSNYKPIDENEYTGEIFGISKCDRNAIENRDQGKMFCESILAYLDNDPAKLWDCCKKAHLSKNSFERICAKTFLPEKACACKLIIAARFDLKKATQLLESAEIYTCKYNKFDVVMSFFFQNKIYDFSIINKTLHLLDLPVLGYAFA